MRGVGTGMREGTMTRMIGMADWHGFAQDTRCT